MPDLVPKKNNVVILAWLAGVAVGQQTHNICRISSLCFCTAPTQGRILTEVGPYVISEGCEAPHTEQDSGVLV